MTFVREFASNSTITRDCSHGGRLIFSPLLSPYYSSISVIGSCFLGSPQSVLASIPWKRSDCTPKHRTLICSFWLVDEGTEQTTRPICDNLPSTQCRFQSKECVVSMRCGGLFAPWVGINTRLQVGRKPTVPRTRSLFISLYPPPMASSAVTVVVRFSRYKIFIPMTLVPVLGISPWSLARGCL
jgi:hypothetical protein